MDDALAKMLDLQWFHDHGWTRKTCPTCGEAFWTLDADRNLCGDSTCEEYQFLGDPLTDDPMSLADMREAFLAYWEDKGHTRVPRNPVVARWRDDIYLTIASIANYQPHTTSGEVPPPANPLVVSQPCIRLNDLANIGRSGRHFACFEMMGHHAFNDATRSAEDGWGEHYWTEECVRDGHAFLTDTLGLDGSRITYKEALWHGGGNAGPCVEVFAGGLEVATLVFMCLEECDADDDGADYQVADAPYRMMDLRIIDTGWGLERLAWASTGTPTAYDTVFPDAIEHIRSLATVPIADDDRSRRLVEMHARVQGVLNLDVGTRLDTLRAEVVERMKEHGIDTTVEELETVMGPIEALYALCDHLRCLSFMVGDGVVPGNVKAGYLMRLVFRRAFRFREALGIEAPLSELVAWNMEKMLAEFPEFEPAIDRAREMAALEQERFLESRDRGVRLVERTLQKKKTLTVEDLVEFYDTHGLGPHTVAEAAAKTGVDVEVPDTFDALIAERHGREKKTKAKRLVPKDVPATRRIFYEDEGQWQREFDAEVTWVHTNPDNSFLLTLNQTCFFHDTGGQPGDQGILTLSDGSELRINDTTKDGEQPLHHCTVVKGPNDEGMAEDAIAQIQPGLEVHGEVDWDLRMDHTRSHTATHIMNQTVRRILGSHSWQAGTQKYADCARVDMTHYRRPTQDELHRIEALANAVVMQGRPVLREWWKRNEAEAKWGTQLLQGGIPKGTDVRVVRIAALSSDGPAAAAAADDLDATEGPVKPDEDYDVEYCGGTHCHTTQEVGPIKMYRTERVQDGVERFEYSAGLHGVAKWQHEQALLRDAAGGLAVAPDELPQAAARFFTEWKERGKLLEAVQAQLAGLKAQAAAGDAEDVGGVRIVVQDDLQPGALQKTAAELLGNGATVALLAAPDGDQVRLLFGRSKDLELDMGSVLREAAALMGGKGGGRPDFAQGAGSDAGKLGACLEKARDLVRDGLGA